MVSFRSASTLQYADGTELLLQDFHMSGNAASVELPSGVWDDKLVAIENSNNVTVALSQSGSASLVSVLAGAPISEAMALSTAYGAPAMAGSTSAVLLGVLGLGGAAIVLGANTGNDKSPTPQPDASVTAAPAGVHTITLSDDTGTAGDRRTTDGAVKITLNLGNSLTLASDEVLQVSADGGKTWVATTGAGTTWATANNAVILQPGAGQSIIARIADTAGNTSAITVSSNNYEWQEVTLGGSVTMGPVISGTALAVVLYKADGSYLNGTLENSRTSVAVNGNFSLNTFYKGQVIAKVVDVNGLAADYMDEATAAAKDFSGQLLALGEVALTPVALHINILSTIAAQMVGVDIYAVTPTLRATPAAVAAANLAVSVAFGLGSTPITELEAQPVIGTNGLVQTGNSLGTVLAALSGMEFNGQGMDSFVAQVAPALQSGTSLNDTLKSQLLQGVATVNAKLPTPTLDEVSQIVALLDATAAATASALPADVSGQNLAGLRITVLASLSEAQVATITTAQLQSLSGLRFAALADKLDSLTGAQLTDVLSADQIGAIHNLSLFGANLPFLGNTAMGFISPAQMALLSSSDIKALFPAQLQALSPQAANALTASQINGLTSAQINALTAAVPDPLQNIQNLNEQQKGEAALLFTPLQVASISDATALTPSVIAALSNKLAALNPNTVAAIDSTQIATVSNLDQLGSNLASLNSTTVAAIDSTQIATVSNLDQLGSNLQSLNTTTVNAISSEQLGTVTDLDSLGNNLQNLSTATVNAISTSQLNTVTDLDSLGSNLASLNTTTVAAIDGTQIDTLADLSQLGSNLSALSSAAVASIYSTQAATITSSQLTSFDAADLDHLDVNALSSLSSTNITGLTSEALASLSDAQLNALTSAQITALQISGDLNLLTAEQRAKLTNDTTPPAAPTFTQAVNKLTITLPEAGASVKIYNGSVDVTAQFTLSTNANGTVTAVPAAEASGLYEGTEQLTLKATDAKINHGVASSAFAVDTVAPDSPTLISVTDNYGLTQGTINAGDTTDDITPTVRFSLTGTQAVVGDSIQLYNGSAAVGSAQVITLNDMVNGYVHVTPSPLYTGTYSFNAKLIDAAGNASDASNSHAATLVITANQRLQGMPGVLDDPIFLWDPYANVLNPLGDPYANDTQTLALSDGGYVIAWSAPTPAIDDQGADVFLQRYTASNEALAGVQRLQGASGLLTDARVSLTALSAGQYLVAWESETVGAQGFNIQLQRFKASNLPDGPAQVLSATSTAEDRAPKVTTLTNGGYVVAWQADIADVQGKDVFFQVYDSNGAAEPGGVHQIGAETGNFDDGMPNMAALSDGGFVISWSAQTASSGQDVFVQPYDPLAQAIYGAPIRLEGTPGTTLINADSVTMGSSVPSVTALSDGAYVVVWAAATAQTPDVFMQRFGADNAPLGGVIQLGSGDYTSVWYPKVITLSNGGFVVAWTASKADDLEAWDVYLRSFDSQGNSVVTHRLSAASQLGSYFWDTDVHLTALSGGGYVVSWQGADAIGWYIYTQQYGANDTAVGPVQSLRSELRSDENYTPFVSAMLDGGYVVSWQGVTFDEQGYDLFAQRFDAQGKPWQSTVSISDDTGTAGDRITTDSQVQVTLTLANALTLAGDETLQVSADGGTTWVATTGTGTSWSTVDNAVALQAGTGSVTARIVNGAGNASAITLNSNNYVNVVASRIDLGTDTAANSLNLVLADVLDMSGMNQFNSGNGWTGLDALVQRHQLVVDGSANDAINLEDHANWTQAATATSSISGTTQNYDVYNHNTAAAQLLVDADMSRTWLVI